MFSAVSSKDYFTIIDRLHPFYWRAYEVDPGAFFFCYCTARPVCVFFKARRISSCVFYLPALLSAYAARPRPCSYLTNIQVVCVREQHQAAVTDSWGRWASSHTQSDTVYGPTVTWYLHSLPPLPPIWAQAVLRLDTHRVETLAKCPHRDRVKDLCATWEIVRQ